MTAPRSSLRLVTWSALLAVACTGQVGEPDPGASRGEGAAPAGDRGPEPDGVRPGSAPGTSAGSGAPPPTAPPAAGAPPGGAGAPRPGPFVPAPGGLRRLTDAQVGSSLTALLGDVPIDAAGADVRSDGLVAIGSTRSSVAPAAVEHHASNVDRAVGAVFATAARRAALVGCDPAAALAPCARTFVARFGGMAWRRPLTDAEIDAKVKLADTAARAYGDPGAGLSFAASALLQSPYFLYRVELGEPDPSQAGRLRYSSTEMASRLAFALTDAPPDAELLQAGERGDLVDRDRLLAQADRLLAGQRYPSVADAFAADYLQLDSLATLTKDAKKYPQLSPAVRAALVQQAVLSFRDVATGTGSALDLLTTDATYVNADLATFYGLPKPSGGGFARTTWPASSRRAGVLTSAGVLAILGRAAETSTAGRGRFLNEAVLCRPIADPPPGAESMADNASASAPTKRQRLEFTTKTQLCAACHVLLNPPGLALETFDTVGAERSTENGAPIDASGELDGAAFTDAKGLMARLRAHPSAKSCFVRHVYRFATGRHEESGEEAVIDALTAAFEREGGFRALLRNVVTSDGFRFTRRGGI